MFWPLDSKHQAEVGVLVSSLPHVRVDSWLQGTTQTKDTVPFSSPWNRCCFTQLELTHITYEDLSSQSVTVHVLVHSRTMLPSN